MKHIKDTPPQNFWNPRLSVYSQPGPAGFILPQCPLSMGNKTTPTLLIKDKAKDPCDSWRSRAQLSVFYKSGSTGFIIPRCDENEQLYRCR